jgi:multidrug efflux pump subunit AcrA (membrane-fusion protein)
MALNQYNSARANYDSQLTQLKAQIDGTSWQKNSLSQQIENSQIKAPYDGVVIAKNIEIWSSVWQGAVTFIIATSQEKIVKLDVNAENVKYLNLWEKVTVKKQDKETEGVISVVWAGANANTSMYPVEVRFSSIDFWQNVVLWDFVDVSINKKVWDKNIVLPFSALIANSNGTYHVLLVGSWNLVTEKNVEIWASNSSEIIIRSGLNIWDRVIVNGALNVTLWDKVEER